MSETKLKNGQDEQSGSGQDGPLQAQAIPAQPAPPQSCGRDAVPGWERPAPTPEELANLRELREQAESERHGVRPPDPTRRMRIALIGNPNAGKTTLFNELTGSNQHVGNWPGVTVEQKTGSLRERYAGNNGGMAARAAAVSQAHEAAHAAFHARARAVAATRAAASAERSAGPTAAPDAAAARAAARDAAISAHAAAHEAARAAHQPPEVIDLPGIYSLSPFSAEEVVARNYIIREQPDVVVDIIDGTNLERNLYLAVQLMELDVPLVLAINMMDQVEADGKQIDCEQLARDFGVQVVPISGAEKKGLGGLMWAIHQASRPTHHELPNPALERLIAITEHLLHDHLDREHLVVRRENDFQEYTKMGFPLHWLASKVLESDELVLGQLTLDEATEQQLNQLKDEFEETHGLLCSSFADARYNFIRNVIADGLTDVQEPKRLFSDRVDRVLTNKYASIPIFLGVMLVMFHLTFSESLLGIPGVPSPGVFLQNCMQTAVDAFTGLIGPLFIPGSWAYSLVIDGVVAGIGSVLSFVPQILLLFLFLTILEDCGYMARAAFVMNNIFKRFGLSGKSALPMLMGFGCNVPAAMACRTLDNVADRRLTLFLVPFMSCGARAPIFLAFAAAFFSANTDLVVFGLYLLGIVVALLSGVILKKLLVHGETTPFVIELPRYRLPQGRTVLLTLWEKLRGYLVRAGTVIFGMSIVIWFLSNFGFTDAGFGMVAGMSDSLLAMLGHLISPIFIPLGFGTWAAAVALLTGFIAKETVVGTLGVLTAGAAPSGGQVVSAAGLKALGFTPLSSLSFMVFCLLYIPCMAAVATFAKEFNSWKWTVGQVCYTLGVAWIISFAVYGVGTLLGFA